MSSLPLWGNADWSPGLLVSFHWFARLLNSRDQSINCQYKHSADLLATTQKAAVLKHDDFKTAAWLLAHFLAHWCVSAKTTVFLYAVWQTFLLQLITFSSIKTFYHTILTKLSQYAHRALTLIASFNIIRSEAVAFAMYCPNMGKIVLVQFDCFPQ